MQVRVAVLTIGALIGIACRPVPEAVPQAHSSSLPAAPESSPFPILNGEEAWTAHKAGVLFMDARPRGDYFMGHVPGAVHVPLREQDFEDRLWDFLAGSRSKPNEPVVVYCSGCCSTDALFLAVRLKDMGFKKIRIYRDGFPGWARAERPIATGPNS